MISFSPYFIFTTTEVELFFKKIERKRYEPISSRKVYKSF